MLKRDQRFKIEKERLTRAGLVRLGSFIAISSVSVMGLLFGASELYQAAFSDPAPVELMTLEPESSAWKKKPENPGGRAFLNVGLEINQVQAELFDLPKAEELRLAPPPDDF